MNRNGPLTAEEIVNNFSEKQLQTIIRDLGQEPRWKRSALAIVEARRKERIKTTKQLSDLLVWALKTKTRGTLHPATLVFQGLRIYVNDELEVLKKGLSSALKKLAPGGRLGVISFHSLEDRIVKELFKEASKSLKQPFSKEKQTPLFRLLTKKPLEPSREECRKNPRSRSAKMRFIERIPLGGD